MAFEPTPRKNGQPDLNTLKSQKKPRYLQWVGLLLALISTAFLVLFFDWKSVGSIFRQSNGWKLALFFLIHIWALIHLQQWRLWLFCGGRVGGKDTFAALCLGIFSNQFLPGGVGGDLARVWELKRRSDLSLSEAFSVSLWFRLTGLAFLFGVALLWIPFAPRALDLEIWQKITWAPGQGILFLVFGLGIFVVLFWIPSVRKKILEFGTTFRNMAAVLTPGQWIGIFLLTFSFHFFRALALDGYLTEAGGEGFVRFNWAIVLPLMAFFALLPLAMGGLGVIEGVITVVLVLLGVPEAVALYVAISNRIAVVLAALLGGACYTFLGVFQPGKRTSGKTAE